ncbi:MAG: type II toxin-antitoxin system PemK/MazF family toxin [Myxococcales bacterium]|nr:type II toxin-antitoxin system PemK/MazF family toxin [Myxococcales bacterium]
MTRAPRRGFLYFARLDKRRPVLVISSNARNQGASDVLVVPCSTMLSAAPTHVRLRKGGAGPRSFGNEVPEQLSEPAQELPRRRDTGDRSVSSGFARSSVPSCVRSASRCRSKIRRSAWPAVSGDRGSRESARAVPGR